MDTANDNNQSLETDTSVVDGADTVEVDDEGVPEDILASISDLRDEENGVLDSHLSGDDSTAEENEETVEETAEDANTDTETDAVGDEDRKGAIAHLLAKNLTMEQIETIEQADPSMVLALARSHGWNKEAAADDAAAGATKETTDETADQGDTKPAAFDEAAVVEAISEELGEEFGEAEVSVIGKAIAKAVGMGRGDGVDNAETTERFGQMTSTINLLTGYIENMLIDSEIPRLAEIYPGINEEGGRQRLVDRIELLNKQGIKAKDPQELMRTAAVLEWGSAAADQQKQFRKKVSRSKVSGQPTSKAGGDDTSTHNDDKGLGLVKEWMGSNT